MEDSAVLLKKESAIKWCQNASDNAAKHGGKPWRYALIPHTAIADNMTLADWPSSLATSRDRSLAGLAQRMSEAQVCCRNTAHWSLGMPSLVARLL